MAPLDLSVYVPHSPKFLLRDISLTMGAGGLMNRWGGGDHSILVPYFGGDHSISDPVNGGDQEIIISGSHKIDLMEEHCFKIFAATPQSPFFHVNNISIPHSEFIHLFF